MASNSTDLATPRLPPELERYVFELSALACRNDIPSLLRVAHRVHVWIEPLLYEALILDYSIQQLPNERCLTPTNSRDDVTGTSDLALWVPIPLPDLLPLLQVLPLARLSADITHLFGGPLRVNFSHPAFRALTHLDVLAAGFDDWHLYGGLANMPSLTHLAFRDKFHPRVLHGALTHCGGLRALGVIWSARRGAVEVREGEVVDARLFVVVCADSVQDWETAARGGADIWARAEAFISKKSAGEIPVIGTGEFLPTMTEPLGANIDITASSGPSLPRLPSITSTRTHAPSRLPSMPHMSSDDFTLLMNPKLPPELERAIFELSALRHTSSISAYMRVARRVHVWLEPLLYETLILDYSWQMFPGDGQTPADLRPAAFLAPRVKHLSIRGSLRFIQLVALLRAGTGITSLALREPFPPEALFVPLRETRLVRLAAYVFGCPPVVPVNLEHPTLAALTHLDVLATPLADDWAQYAALARLPQLTPLAFHEFRPRLLRGALRHCKRLCALGVILLSRDDKAACPEEGVVVDARLFMVVCDDPDGDWEEGARGGRDFWARGDALVAKKEAGEIAGSHLWVE
ncbi:hypothetical protein DFH07DRAFT_990444 [Mycena maculata]|uniref:Uncharacterized protein n=1 Tax=Mycena maculata TaxID=230809 RepID=A0AAD7MW22_9AGAR|nr:hypothetical protein DFH07DRAFT_990444 [Mycena maculata]